MIGKTGAKMIPLDSNFSFNVGLNVAWGGKKKSSKELKTLTFWRMPDPEAQDRSAQETQKPATEKKQQSATDNTGKNQQPDSSGQKSKEN